MKEWMYDIFKCKKFIAKRFEEGKIFDLSFHVMREVIDEQEATIILTTINGKESDPFSIETEFPIWTINRISVIFKFYKECTNADLVNKFRALRETRT